MFTGIIEQLGKVEDVKDTGEHTVFEIFSGIFDDISTGDSISINGTCLSVTELKSDTFKVDMVNETRRVTSLDQLSPGDDVNLERAMKLSDRLGGHLVSGHVDGTGEIVSIGQDGSAVVMTLRLAEDLMKYMAHKGSVTVDGISLTIFEVSQETSEIILNLIPETQDRTILPKKAVGERVNIEADMLLKHVEHLLKRGEIHV